MLMKKADITMFQKVDILSKNPEIGRNLNLNIIKKCHKRSSNNQSQFISKFKSQIIQGQSWGNLNWLRQKTTWKKQESLEPQENKN